MQDVRRISGRGLGQLTAEVSSPGEAAAAANAFLKDGAKVVILDDGTFTAALKEPSLAGAPGRDYCVITAGLRPQRQDGAFFEFVNLNAMAMMGVAVLTNDSRLFELAYELFNGSRPPQNTMRLLDNRELWFVEALPRIEPITKGAAMEESVRRIFLSAA